MEARQPLANIDTCLPPPLSKKARLTQALAKTSLVVGLSMQSIYPEAICASEPLKGEKPDTPTSEQAAESFELMPSLSISTYNIGGAENGINKISQAIQAQDSSIVCLQEVTNDDVARLAASSGMRHAIPGWALSGDYGAYGNAIMTDLPVLDSATYKLDAWNNHEQRILLTTTLRHGTSELVVAVTHLVNKPPGMFKRDRPSERQRQAETILTILDEARYRGKDILLCGDFNSSPGSATHRLLSSQYADVGVELGLPPINTFPWNGSQKDYIWYRSQALKPLQLQVWGGNASDHCGLTAVLVPKPPIAV